MNKPTSTPDQLPGHPAQHSSANLSEHLIELEIKISHQDIAIEELKQTVFEQHIAIEKLEKELKRLNDRIADSGPVIGPGNEKPPHY